MESKKLVVKEEKVNKLVQYPQNLAWSLLLIILGFNIFEYGSAFGIGRGLYHLVVTIAVFITLPLKRRNFIAFMLTVVSGLSALLVGYHANGFVQWFNLTVANLALLGLFIISALPIIHWKIWSLVQTISRFFVRSIYQWLVVLGDLTKSSVSNGSVVSKTLSSFKKTLSIIKTTTITVILLYFFAKILSSADPIFSKIIDSILSESFGRIFKSIILVSIMAILLTIALPEKDDHDPDIGFFSTQDILVSIGALLVLFAIFLAVQFRYLFASHEIFQTFGLTYSQYVRKGFFELLVATSIGSIISYLIVLKRRNEESKRTPLSIINTLLLIELFLILASAYRRDLMYIDVFGLTRARIVGEIFLFWLTGGTMLLFVHSIWEKFQEKYVIGGIGIVTIGVLLYLNTVNMDMKIDYAAPIRDGQKDLFYISNLSEDAYEGWKEVVVMAIQQSSNLMAKTELSEEEKGQLASIKLAAISLQKKREKLEKSYSPLNEVKVEFERAKAGYVSHNRFGDVITGSYDTKPFANERTWQAFNWSEYQAWKSMQNDKNIFYSDLDLIISRISEFQHINNIDLYEKEIWILYDFNYPFVNIVEYYPKQMDIPQPTF